MRKFGHLKRMGSDRIPKMELNVEGRRRKEKPREQWMDEVRSMVCEDAEYRVL